MRIYLTESKTVIEETRLGSKRKRFYPSAGFYANVPDERALEWLEEGTAFEATDDNKVVAFKVGCDAATLIDFDAGDTLEDCFNKPQPAPEPEPEPEPEVIEDPSSVAFIDDTDALDEEDEE